MKVYVLVTVYGYNDSEILGIYITKQLAEKAAEKAKMKCKWAEYIVEEYELEGLTQVITCEK